MFTGFTVDSYADEASDYKNSVFTKMLLDALSDNTVVNWFIPLLFVSAIS